MAQNENNNLSTIITEGWLEFLLDVLNKLFKYFHSFAAIGSSTRLQSVAHLGAFSAVSCDLNAPPSSPFHLFCFPPWY